MKKLSKIQKELEREHNMRKEANFFRTVKTTFQGLLILSLVSLTSCEPAENEQDAFEEELVKTSAIASTEESNPAVISFPDGVYEKTEFVPEEIAPDTVMPAYSITKELNISRGSLTEIIYIDSEIYTERKYVLGECIQVGTSNIYAFELYLDSNPTRGWLFVQSGSDVIVRATVYDLVESTKSIIDFKAFSEINSTYYLNK